MLDAASFAGQRWNRRAESTCSSGWATCPHAPNPPDSGRSNRSKHGGVFPTAKHRRDRARKPALWVPPTAPALAPNDAPERRPSPSWPQRRTAPRVCSRSASMLGVGRMGPRRQPAIGGHSPPRFELNARDQSRCPGCATVRRRLGVRRTRISSEGHPSIRRPSCR